MVQKGKVAVTAVAVPASEYDTRNDSRSGFCFVVFLSFFIFQARPLLADPLVVIRKRELQCTRLLH